MKQIKKTVYRINGEEYHSLDELPPHLREIITPEFIKKLKKNPSTKKFSKTIIRPISDQDLSRFESDFEAETDHDLSWKSDSKQLQGGAGSWQLYIVSLLGAFFISQAMRSLALRFDLGGLSFAGSILPTLFIGHVSYALCVSRQQKKNDQDQAETVNQPEYVNNSSFGQDSKTYQLSLLYNLVVNLIFYASIYLIINS